MKKVITYLSGFGCVFAVLFAGAENADGSCSLVWTVGCMVVAVLLGRIYVRLSRKEERNV